MESRSWVRIVIDREMAMTNSSFSAHITIIQSLCVNKWYETGEAPVAQFATSTLKLCTASDCLISADYRPE